jgi:protocatechuate 3,4-dioxygenase beta subunit
MADSSSSAFSRRRFLYAVAIAAAPVAFVARAQTLLGQGSDMVELAPTPAVGEQLELTQEETAGPFFRPNSPLKADFRESNLTGEPIKVSGFVLNRRGKPVAGALLDFWHADGDGEYDLKAFRCRGHQFSDANGRYTLETIVPGLYPGMARVLALSYTFREKPETSPIRCSVQICFLKYRKRTPFASPHSISSWK